jgi:signal transduction histidine kinase
VDAVASRADQADVALNTDFPATDVLVIGDADRLQTAIGSLLDNALKFTPTGGVVLIGIRSDAQLGRLWVSDTGIGIPQGDMPGLFERFHRGRNATAYAGSGLGLAIVRATAEIHGGTVHAESSGAGSWFELTLPLAPSLSAEGSDAPRDSV